MALIDQVKTALRLKTDVFDDELTLLIRSCETDMAMSGVKVILKEDALTQRAIILYVKANFGDLDENGRYQSAYNNLKNSMAISSEYGTEDG